MMRVFKKGFYKKHSFRNLKKRFLYPLYASHHASKNHKDFLKVLANQKDPRTKVVPPIGGGDNEKNFYHFIFDYLLPLYQVTKQLKNSQRVSLLVSTDNTFNRYFDLIFPDKLNLVKCDSLAKEQNYSALVGMNPQYVSLDFGFLEEFRNQIYTTLDLNFSKEKSKVVLIERKLNSESKYIGANKRSITNHEDLKHLVKSRLSPSFEFVNVQLEELTLEDQIILFKETSLVIAQHGAGLANCLWMDSGTHVVEFSNNYYNRHYKNLARFNKLNHTTFQIRKMHGTVNLERFDTEILSNTTLDQYFNQSN